MFEVLLKSFSHLVVNQEVSQYEATPIRVNLGEVWLRHYHLLTAAREEANRRAATLHRSRYLILFVIQVLDQLIKLLWFTFFFEYVMVFIDVQSFVSTENLSCFQYQLLLLLYKRHFSIVLFSCWWMSFFFLLAFIEECSEFFFVGFVFIILFVLFTPDWRPVAHKTVDG